jgi:hypothetical protein
LNGFTAFNGNMEKKSEFNGYLMVNYGNIEEY